MDQGRGNVRGRETLVQQPADKRVLTLVFPFLQRLLQRIKKRIRPLFLDLFLGRRAARAESSPW